MSSEPNHNRQKNHKDFNKEQKESNKKGKKDKERSYYWSLRY